MDRVVFNIADFKGSSSLVPTVQSTGTNCPESGYQLSRRFVQTGRESCTGESIRVYFRHKMEKNVPKNQQFQCDLRELLGNRERAPLKLPLRILPHEGALLLPASGSAPSRCEVDAVARSKRSAAIIKYGRSKREPVDGLERALAARPPCRFATGPWQACEAHERSRLLARQSRRFGLQNRASARGPARQASAQLKDFGAAMAGEAHEQAV